MHWAPPLTSNCVAWPATALGSSPKAIDLDEPSKIDGLALHRAPLHRYASIPITITSKNANLRVNPNDLHTNSFTIPTLRACQLATLLVPTPYVNWTILQSSSDHIARHSVLQIDHLRLPSGLLRTPITCI